MRRNTGSGTMTKLSWSCPRTLPIFCIIPITVSSSFPTRMLFPMGSMPEKQLLYQGVADQANVSAVFAFRFREVAAELNGARVNIRHARRLP